MRHMKWLIERTDVTPSKYFARWYGGDQWTEEPMTALQFDTKHAAHQEWIDSLQKNPSLKPFEDKVEMCEHQF